MAILIAGHPQSSAYEKATAVMYAEAVGISHLVLLEGLVILNAELTAGLVEGVSTIEERPGYRGPEGGWPNLIEGDDYRSPKAPTLQEMFESGDYKDVGTVVWPREGDTPAHFVETTKYNYVIDSEGNVRVGRAGDPRYKHHSDLVQGENVYGAGEMYIDPDGTIRQIDDQSGHYKPASEDFFPYLKHLLGKSGFTPPDEVFRSWN